MKLFLSSTSLLSSYGGPAHSVCRLAESLAAEGVEVGLWAADGSAPSTPLLPPAVPVTRLDGTVESALQAFGRPDVVHDNGLWLLHNHRLAVLAAKRGIPRTVSTRGMLEPWAMQHKRFKKRLAWLAYQRKDLGLASGIHATNEVEARNIERFDLGVPVRVIPNGVDLPAIEETVDKKQGVRTALFLGRIYPVKGLPMLIEAWARVRPAGWRLVIAGPDEAGHGALVRKLVKDAGLGDVIEFAGQLSGDAKRQAFSSAELFVLPTHSESFGVAIAEALSYEVPVLTTTAAPWPELEARGCGWSVAPTSEGVAQGLAVATARSREELARMGQSGRAYVAANYAWSVIGPDFRNWFSAVSRG
ncbi:MAG TPA: glycosyltransferase [Gemmatimonadaceae bacterium]|nr:glycosyltransferase [Gemmatimonadaceae bacterium]